MPCNMMEGATSGDFAQASVSQLERRVAELEQALCGLCRMLERDGVQPELSSKHPQLSAWFTQHKAKPGCEA